MAKKYQVNGVVRFVNRLMVSMIGRNVAAPQTYALTTRGRKTGKPHSNPVYLVEREGKRWLVAPYGEVSWVKNARAAGEVSIARGGRAETLKLNELAPNEAAPILKQYVREQSISSPYFEVGVDAPVEEFEAIAGKHPVFLLKAS